MARSRNIKPGFFKNEILAELGMGERLLFIGLWTIADREGRMEDRPRRMKAELFPFDDGINVEAMLSQLNDKGFVIRYEVDGVKFLSVCNFVRHQDPHYKEKASELPPPPGEQNRVLATGVTKSQRARILERDGFACKKCATTEHLSIDHVVPVSRGGDSSDDNLQVLCFPCNTQKSNKLDGETRASKPRKGEIGDYDPSPPRPQSNVESNSNQQKRALPSDSLIPDSLIPDTGLSDSPTPESGKKKPRLRRDLAVRPFVVSEKVWNDFLALRQAKRAPLTETALEVIGNEAIKAGMTLQMALETCCARGWQGFEASWMKNDSRGTSDPFAEFVANGEKTIEGERLADH